MALPMTQNDERRLFRRVQAEVFARPYGKLTQGVGRPSPRKVKDISMGGLRVYADEGYDVGQRIEMEIFFADGDSATVHAEVVWVDALPAGAPARFDVGLRYLDVRRQDLARIAQVLEAVEPG